MTRSPKTRKLRVHATGTSAKCKAGKCADCSMLECQHDCHETEQANSNEIFMLGIAVRAYRQNFPA